MINLAPIQPGSSKDAGKENRKVISWCMYDWANSAFATIIMAAVLPIFYGEVAGSSLSKTTATSYWGYTNTLAMIIIAVSSPILGSIGDYTSRRKGFLCGSALVGIMATGLLFFTGEGLWLAVSVLYIIGKMGFNWGNIFYDALLPYVAHEGSIDRVSSLGYALGYLGGGILLAVNLLMIMKPGLFFIPDQIQAMRISFLSVSIWWTIFSIPLLIFVPEPRNSLQEKASGILKKSISNLLDTFHRISDFKEAFKFLIAFWLYNDGINTIIIMAAIFGAEIGIGRNHLIGSIMIVQFVGIPFTILFGSLSQHLGTKLSILAGLVIYTLVVIFGYFLKSPKDFLILAIMVGLVQGGTQALSRSLFIRMIPRDESAKFFSFYDVTAKFSGIFGPALFGLVGQITGSSRYGIAALIIFFMAGGGILLTVHPERVRISIDSKRVKNNKYQIR